MSSFITLACGNCVYYAMWQKFPPTASWVLIVPGWFLVLSLIRTWAGRKLFAIPNVYIALPLVLAVFLFAAGMIGPPLGFWIPVCCLIGTLSGLRSTWKTPAARTIVTVTLLAVASLVAFGVHDYWQYAQMPAAEKERFLPEWKLIKKSQQNAE